MIRIRHWKILLCLAAIASADTSSAKDTGASPDSAEWVHLGGGSGGLDEIEFHPTRPQSIAAGWALGLCTTTDGGGHWRMVTDYPSSSPLTLLGWDPDSSAGLFARGNEDLLRSPDAGEHWSVRTPGSVFGGLRGLTLVAGDRVGYAGSDKGVFKTSDGGAHWGRIWTPPGNPIVLKIVRNRAVPDGLFAIQSRAMWRSANAGKSWRKVLTTEGTVRRLLWHQLHPELLLAATNDGALHRSVDGGVHWLPAAPPTRGPIALASHPAADDAIYAGASLRRQFVSYDAGGQWLPTGGPAAAGDSGAASLRLLEPNPASPGTLYAQSREGLFRSADSGRTWSRADAGMSLMNVQWIAVNPDREGMVLVGGIFGGVARSLDGGVNWDPLRLENIPMGLTAGGEPGDFFIAGLVGGVMRSRDGGDRWDGIHHGLLGEMGRYNARSLAVGPPPGRVLYVQVDSTHWVSDYGIATRRLFKSTDGGDSWTPAGEGLPDAEIDALVADPTVPDRVYATTRSSSGRVDSLWRTHNGGGKWEPLEFRLPELRIRKLAVVPSRPSTVLVLAEAGLFSSRDAGLTWQPAGNGLPPPNTIENLTPDPGHPGRIYASSSLEVFVSEDDGGRWRQLAAGPPRSINCIAVDARAGDLYAGTRQGVYVLRGVAR